MKKFAKIFSVFVLGLFPGLALAVEGGMGAYLLGSRDSFAGIVPGPGSYLSFDLVSTRGNIDGLSLAGLPIRADSDLSVTFAKLSYTYVPNAELWGGQPAFNLTVPYVFDATLDYTGITPPFVGVPISDSTSGLSDITLTSLVGWHDKKWHYSAAFSVFAPTGSYEKATVDIPNRTISALNTGKNIWSFQPVFAATYFDPASGFEFSGAASLLFSTRNSATDYQNAPALNLEASLLQHTKSGWAFGATGYAYSQIGDDSGAGAEATRAALGAESLSGRVFGLGPILTYSGATFLGQEASFKLKYYKEFGAKRRFESDVLWMNMALTF